MEAYEACQHLKMTIQNLSDRHWEAILEGAREYLGKKVVVLT
jgi:hypothetical protein